MLAPVYAALVGVFVYAVAQSYVPGKGFSALITFGGKTAADRLAAMNELDYYLVRDAVGYDGQYYAQIAMAPSLRDPQLRTAVDSLPYRARRILFSWTAFVLGFGRPAWILQAFALQNALCWLALAAVLLRWFPPDNASNLLRWAGVLFSYGLCVSVRNSLVDGPSLLLIALGVWAVEKNRPWLATGIFALGGLGKETNVLGAAALARPAESGLRGWLAPAGRALVVAAPLALWLLYLRHRDFGPVVDVGARNFDWPFAAYAQTWRATLADVARQDTVVGASGNLLILVALTVQWLFLVLRPQPAAAWWRAGLPFALLMVVLGGAVWEGYPGAAARVLVTMQLAFNVLVPRGRAWMAVLVLGNLSLLTAPDALKPPTGDGYRFSGPARLIVAPDGAGAGVEFDAAWFAAEGHHENTWHWSRGDGTLVIVNPQKFPVTARVTFMLRSITPRTVRVRRGAGEDLWRGAVGAAPTPVEFGPLTLAPGPNAVEFTTDQPAARAANGDARPLAFSVAKLVIELHQ